MNLIKPTFSMQMVLTFVKIVYKNKKTQRKNRIKFKKKKYFVIHVNLLQILHKLLKLKLMEKHVKYVQDVIMIFSRNKNKLLIKFVFNVIKKLK